MHSRDEKATAMKKNKALHIRKPRKILLCYEDETIEYIIE